MKEINVKVLRSLSSPYGIYSPGAHASISEADAEQWVNAGLAEYLEKQEDAPQETKPEPALEVAVDGPSETKGEPQADDSEQGELEAAPAQPKKTRGKK